MRLGKMVLARLVQALVGLLLVANVAYYASKPTRAALLFALGRESMCSFGQTMTDMKRDAARDEFHAATRDLATLIRKEVHGSLYRLVDGRLWWFPPRGEQYASAVSFERWAAIPGVIPIHEGDIVLDCGAYTGESTRVALNMGASLVVAMEPAPPAIVCIKRNLQCEIEAGRVIVCEKGVWDRDDFLRLGEHEETSAADSVLREGTGPVVPLTTIDKLVRELNLPRVDFIKMDIEGAEQKALKGAQETIRRFRPRLAIGSYHLPNDYREIPRIVRAIRGDYRMSSGRCGVYYFRVSPGLLYFD